MFEAYITNAALYPEAGVEVGNNLEIPGHHAGGSGCPCEDRD